MQTPESLRGGPFQPFVVIFRNRSLVYRLVLQDTYGRYKGSLLGVFWSIVTPLLSLAVYAFIFGTVLPARWPARSQNYGEFALVLFTGLMIFQTFSEVVARAPTLLLENISYLKKVVFPVEVLAAVTVLSAALNLLISLIILLVANAMLGEFPHWSVVLLPLILAPFLLLTLGAAWLLSAIGVFIRDMRQVVTLLISLLMFLSPIFYPVSALPEYMRAWVYLNPVTLPVEDLREIVIFGQTPNFAGLAVYLLASWGAAWFGLWAFAKLRKAFADVV